MQSPRQQSAPVAAHTRCACCGYSIAHAGAAVDGTFCSTTCRDVGVDGFTAVPADKLTSTWVNPIDVDLPYGMPRNACVLLVGEDDALEAALQAELAWRRLQAGEPVVLVSFNDTPISVIEQFLLLDWNVLPFLETGQLELVDSFTRYEEPATMVDSRRGSWVEHVLRFVEPQTRTLRDPTDIQELGNVLVRTVREGGMYNRGCVLIDSLTEFATTVPPIRAHQFVKDVRARVCKARFVPLFAGATIADADVFPLNMTHVMDGRIDIRLHEIDDSVMRRELCVRKMDGVPVIARWQAIAHDPGSGYYRLDRPGPMGHPGSSPGP